MSSFAYKVTPSINIVRQDEIKKQQYETTLLFLLIQNIQIGTYFITLLLRESNDE